MWRKRRICPVTRISLMVSALLIVMFVELPAQEGTVPLKQPSGAEELVQRIQDSMQKIDDNLMNAQAEGVGNSLEENIRNIEKLLDETRQQSGQVIQDLEDLIQSVKYQQCSSGGSSDSPPPPDPNKSEQKPENQPRSEQEEQGLQKHDDASKSNDPKEDGKPENGKPDDSPGSKTQSKTPPTPGDSEKTDHPDVSGRWGVLPPKIQNDILNFNIESFPQKYRKWLEEYYKRINRQKKNR